MTWYDDYRDWLTTGQSMHNAQLVVNHFAGSDWSQESLSAMLGNMRHESSINPDMYEYGYDWGDDRGYGLVQWTPRSKYWDWAENRGLPPRQGESQLARIDYEVENNIQWIATSDYPLSFTEFRTNSGNWSVEYLTEAFTWCYERPNQQAGEDSMPDRKQFALSAYDTLDFNVVGSKPAWPTTEGLDITSPYGWRIHPITGDYTFHAAIDIGGGGVNHPIYATQDGTVYQNDYTDGSGWRLRIDHGPDDYYSQYIHLAAQAPVSVGAVVTKGQEVATMGTTGSSTGIHLDFAIATSSTGFYTEAGTIDPEEYLEMVFGGTLPSDPGEPLENVYTRLFSRRIHHRRRNR